MLSSAKEKDRSMSKEQQSGKMWSGRFREPLDPQFEAWQRSLPFDWRLLPQEIEASKAHASALIAAGILSESEGAELRAELDAIAVAHTQMPAKQTCAITRQPRTFTTLLN